MPIFEYRCRECGARFEKYQLNDSARIVCARCASAKVEKLLSVFAVVGSPSVEPSAAQGPCECGAPRRGMCRE